MEAVIERRASVRCAPATTLWAPNATLRPGHDITIVNLTTSGLLVRTRVRVLPGKRVDLQLTGEGKRHSAAGRVLRCRVAGLSPVCYEAAIAVDGGLAVGGQVPQEADG